MTVSPEGDETTAGATTTEGLMTAGPWGVWTIVGWTTMVSGF